MVGGVAVVRGRRAVASSDAIAGINVYTGIGSAANAVFDFDEAAGTMQFKKLDDNLRRLKKLKWIVMHNRVSSVEQACEGHHGLHNQATQVIDAASAKYGRMWDGDLATLKHCSWAALSVNAEVMSGRKKKSSRRVLNHAIAQYRAAKTLGLKPVYGVARLDRAARELETYISIEKEQMTTLVAHGPSLDGPDGRMFARFAVTMGEHEASLIQERTRAGRERAKQLRTERGQTTVHKKMHDTNRDLQAMKDEYAAGLKDTLAVFIQRGMTLKGMAETLNKAGHQTFHVRFPTGRSIGGKPIHDNYVRTLLIRTGLKPEWDALLERREREYEVELTARAAAREQERQARTALRAVAASRGQKRSAEFVSGRIAKATRHRLAIAAQRKEAAESGEAAAPAAVVSLLTPAPEDGDAL